MKPVEGKLPLLITLGRHFHVWVKSPQRRNQIFSGAFLSQSQECKLQISLIISYINIEDRYPILNNTLKTLGII